MKNKIFKKSPINTSKARLIKFLPGFIIAVAFFCISGRCLALDCGAGFENIGGVCFPTETGLSEETVGFILERFFLWLMAIFAILAIIAFVISGIQYLVSAGDQDTLETAKRNAKWSLVGVIVGLSGYIIIRAISSALRGETFF